MEQFVWYFIYFLIFFTGSAIGSFINCLVWRQNNNLKIVKTRSQCVHCGRQLTWWENIPLFSYLFLGGRCKTCRKPIPPYYFINELFTGVLFVLIHWIVLECIDGSFWRLLRDLIFISFLLVIFFGDFLYRVIWPAIIWPGLIVGFLLNAIFLDVSIYSMILGLVVGGGFFALQYYLSDGRWVGGGDVRLGMMMGVWLGFPLIIPTLMVAYFVGGFFGIYLLIMRKIKWGKSTEIAFGPFLVLATVWAMYFGEVTMVWFSKLWI
jgi:leader peptidase (prepilin peptidase) / N-methyltransferase